MVSRCLLLLCFAPLAILAQELGDDDDIKPDMDDPEDIEVPDNIDEAVVCELGEKDMFKKACSCADDSSKRFEKYRMCNGHESCDDSSDEPSWCGFHTCKPKHDPDGQAITLQRSYICNGIENCADGSDEKHPACVKGKFTCGGNYMSYIDLDGETGGNNYYWRCNGFPQCSDGSDELGCVVCKKHRNLMYHHTWRCDGIKDCLEGDDSDEEGCPGYVPPADTDDSPAIDDNENDINEAGEDLLKNSTTPVPTLDVDVPIDPNAATTEDQPAVTPPVSDEKHETTVGVEEPDNEPGNDDEEGVDYGGAAVTAEEGDVTAADNGATSEKDTTWGGTDDDEDAGEPADNEGDGGLTTGAGTEDNGQPATVPSLEERAMDSDDGVGKRGELSPEEAALEDQLRKVENAEQQEKLLEEKLARSERSVPGNSWGKWFW